MTIVHAIISKSIIINNISCSIIILMKKESRKPRSHKKNKAKQHNGPRAVTLLKKNELPRVHVQGHCIYVRIFIELIRFSLC